MPVDRLNDLRPVETTPLIPKSIPSAKRARSQPNTFSFLPRRHLRTRPRLSAGLACKNHIHTGKSDTAASSSYSDESTTPTVLKTYNDDVAWPPTCDSTTSSNDEARSTRRFMPKVSLRLENSGSVARDHLASERTFLAYMRTSLALASSGVALVQLFTVASASSPNNLSPNEWRLHHYIRPLGAVTIVIGIIVLLIGVARYFAIQAALTKGYFPAPRLLMGAIAFTLTVLVTTTFGILVAGKLEPGGRF